MMYKCRTFIGLLAASLLAGSTAYAAGTDGAAL